MQEPIKPYASFEPFKTLRKAKNAGVKSKETQITDALRIELVMQSADVDSGRI